MKALFALTLLPAASALAGNVPPPPQRAVPYSQVEIQYVPCGLGKRTPPNASCGRETAIEAARRGRRGPPISLPYSVNENYGPHGRRR